MKTSNRFFIAVSCPLDVKDQLRWILLHAVVAYYHVVLSHLLLVLSGDVETNPGPVSESGTQTEQFDISAVLQAINRVENGQAKILNQLAEIQHRETGTQEAIQNLSARVAALEMNKLPLDGDAGMSQPQMSEINELRTRAEDAENRLRRNNLLFFGFSDTPTETWKQSEERIISFCSEKLGIALAPINIDRAHRIGAFQQNKSRPIVVRFSRFKERDAVLSSGSKLKGTDFSIRQDVSRSVRAVQKRLLAFGKEQPEKYKLRHDKLIIGERVYVYEAVSDCIVQLKSSKTGEASSSHC